MEPPESSPSFSPRDFEVVIKHEFQSPAILPYHGDLMEDLVKRISDRETQLASKSSGLGNDFAADIATLELDRLRYYLKKYLRIRLAKIERNILHIIQDDLAHLLSKSEYDFAISFYELLRGQLDSQFFAKVDERYGVRLFQENALSATRTTLGMPMAGIPDESKFVFVRLNRPVADLVLDRGTTLKCQSDDVVLAAYKYVRGALEKGMATVV